MLRIFPKEESEWLEFHEWVTVLTSCMITSDMMKASDWSYLKHCHLHDHVWLFDKTVESVYEIVSKATEPTKFKWVSVEVHKLLQFMVEIHMIQNMYLTMDAEKPAKLAEAVRVWHCEKSSLPFSNYESAIDEALQEGKSIGICPNRLWNMTVASSHISFDLVSLVGAIKRTQLTSNFTHKESIKWIRAATTINTVTVNDEKSHFACTSNLCHFASIDSTHQEILCRCQRDCCDKLNFSERIEFRYIWSTTVGEKKASHTLLLKVKYVAISHVWSDGMGAEEGTVHHCVFKYFQKIACDTGCQGLWWDAISIPTESKACSEVIKVMHHNFWFTMSTIVHNLYTAKYLWSENGSPCIALALSPWFTWGWTALELLVSRHIKVIFQSLDNPSEYILKDLDTEVLVSDSASCSHEYWIASTAIRWLRCSQITTLKEVQQILKIRYTSWPHDHSIIASLLCVMQPDASSPLMQGDIAQDILIHFRKIDLSFLIHGCPIEAEAGLFSWCPSTLFNEVKTHISSDLGGTEVWVNPDGTLDSLFNIITLRSGDSERLDMYTTHPAAEVWIQQVLNNWEHCMLLFPLSNFTDVKDPAILVTVLDYDTQSSGCYDCQMEGVVYGAWVLMWTDPAQIPVHLRKKISTWPSKTAQELLELYDEGRDPFNFGPYNVPLGLKVPTVMEQLKDPLSPGYHPFLWWGTERSASAHLGQSQTMQKSALQLWHWNHQEV